MMKKIVGIFVCMLLLCGALVSAISNNKNTQGFVSPDGCITVRIPVGTYEVKQGIQGHEITVEDYGRLLIAGKPNLPAKIFSVAIPPGAQVKKIVFETQNDVLLQGNYRIAPCPLPQIIGEEDPLRSERDQRQYKENYESVYGHDASYPSSVGEVVGTGGYRKYNLVDVRIHPFTYNPVSGALTYHPDITVKVFYTFPAGFSAQDIMIDTSPRVEQKAQELLLNYEQATQWYPNGPVGRQQYDYVIITTESLASSVTSLADWESAKGRSVNVVTVEWIATNYNGYDLSAKIRAFLHEKYPSGEWGIVDVLLAGHWDDVPMRSTAQGCETDYYYAELSLPDSQSWDANGNHQYGESSDPIDFETEVNVGRIPWSEPETMESICAKSVAYEQNSDESFKKNILLLGAFFWDNTDNAVLMEYKTNPMLHPWMADWTMTRMYEDAQSSYPCDYDLSYNNVESVWSTGTYAFVDWAGHGSPEATYEYYPSQPFVDEDTCLSLNDEFPSIIFADSCSNSDTDFLNIGQTMLKQGGVGFLGSNKVAYGQPAWNDPMDGSSQSLDYFFTTCCTSGNYTIGQAHQWALSQMYTHNLWGELRYEQFEWGSIFGNPDLSMGPVSTSDPPSVPSLPSGPARGVIDKEYFFSTVSSDPNGDMISYQFNWGDGTNSEWLGPYTSGLTIAGSHAWAAVGTYMVNAKAKDVHGATSGWSLPYNITIILNNAPDTPTITGPGTGKPGLTYLFKLQTTDMESDMVSYSVDWGDNTTSQWIGPYGSGVLATTTHAWSEKGSYTVKVKAKDTLGDESDWGTLDVTVPRNSAFSQMHLLQTLFERFPHMFPMLRQILGY